MDDDKVVYVAVDSNGKPVKVFLKLRHAKDVANAMGCERMFAYEVTNVDGRVQFQHLATYAKVEPLAYRYATKTHWRLMCKRK